MNTLSKIIIPSPAALEEECASFAIDDTTSPFVLYNLTTPGESYTLSLWIRSNSEGSILVRGTTILTTSEWSKHVVTYTASDTYLKIFFNTTDTYNIYHPKLESGNKATDYTTAPEDIDGRLDDIADDIRDTIDEEVQPKFDELYNYIRIDTETGSMTFGSSENNITLRLENDKISFRKNDVEFGWWDGHDFHTGNIMVEVNERAQFGNFAYIPRSDGSLSFLKVGG
jgi:hypothetical protein